MYHRLLIPVDDASEVEPMIRLGSRMLDAGGEIRVLHVIPTVTIPQVTRGWRSSVNIVIPAHEAGAALDVRVDPEVRASVDVVGDILDSAESHEVDAIVMTLRGDRRSRNPFVGHTASSILHHARCDVVVVNRLALAADKFPRIIVPTFSGLPAPKILQLAEEFALRNPGITIITLSLVARKRTDEPPSPPTEGRSPRGFPVKHKTAMIPEAMLVRRRRLPELILQAAARERYGLLLVGEETVRGEGTLLTRRFLEELFRAAPCPVVAVRG